MTEQDVTVQIIRNPKLKISDVDFKFDVPQKFGGLGRSVTVKRNKLKKLAEKTTYVNLGKQLGLSAYEVNRFINKETLNPILGQKVYDALYSTDLDVVEEVVTKPTRFDSLNKMNIRYLFIQAIVASKLFSGRFFTLPSETCAFENELNVYQANKFHYIGVEHKKETFMDALQTIARLKVCMTLFFGKAKEILMGSTSDSFTHMFLDYCGTLPTFEKEITHTFANNLVVNGGLIGLTFCVREANVKDQTSIEYHQSVLDALNSDAIANVNDGIKLRLLSLIGNSYEIVEFLNYKDNTNMIFALVKRIK